MIYVSEQLAADRARELMELAERLRYARRQRTLRRAQRMEHRAERRLIEAWRRAEELRAGSQPGPFGTMGFD